jgi:N-ATPase, AtpR subunit
MSGTGNLATIALIPLLAGIVVGWLHFTSLRAVSRLLVEGRLSAIVLQVARLAASGLFLYACARFGALQLAAGLAGMMVGRAIALRSARREAS